MSEDDFDSREVVYLLHGVDTELTNGEPYWYRHVMSVLQPFFICVPLRYTEYDRGGKARVATWGGGWAVAFATIGAFLLIGWSGMPSLGAAAMAVTAVGGATLSIREMLRRSDTATKLGSACSSVQATQAPASHFIAHSFGTVMLKKILDRAQLSLRQVILVGSALQRKTNWERLWKQRSDAAKPFVSIRNEHSTNDIVAGLAGLAAPLTGCGSAGKHGFSPCGDTVAYHSIPNAHGPCSKQASLCENGPVVHNVQLEPFTHSDVFLSSDHAKRLWLPVLLNISPVEYDDFLKSCIRVLERRDDKAFLDSRADIFAAKKWTFLSDSGSSLSIRDYVLARLPNIGIAKNPQQHVIDVCVTTAKFFMTAWKDVGPEEKRVHLKPRNAVDAAMKRLLRN